MSTALGIARMIAGALPSALLVVAVFMISTFALLLGDERRAYALQVVDKMLTLAAVLMGVESKTPAIEKTPEKAEEPKQLQVGRHL